MANYVYKPICTVTVGDTDVEIAEHKDAKPGERYCVYERENLGWLEEFHRMEYTDDFMSAVRIFADMTQDQINEQRLSDDQQIGGMQ